MASFGIEHQMEVPDPGRGKLKLVMSTTGAESRKRVADILYYPAGGDLPVLIDVTISNPVAPSYSDQSFMKE